MPLQPNLNSGDSFYDTGNFLVWLSDTNSLYVTCFNKRDHFGFFINIEFFLVWVDSPFYVEYNGESFKSKQAEL